MAQGSGVNRRVHRCAGSMWWINQHGPLNTHAVLRSKTRKRREWTYTPGVSLPASGCAPAAVPSSTLLGAGDLSSVGDRFCSTNAPSVLPLDVTTSEWTLSTFDSVVVAVRRFRELMKAVAIEPHAAMIAATLLPSSDTLTM